MFQHQEIELNQTTYSEGERGEGEGEGIGKRETEGDGGECAAAEVVFRG